jgi:hypothetical protein
MEMEMERATRLTVFWNSGIKLEFEKALREFMESKGWAWSYSEYGFGERTVGFEKAGVAKGGTT